MSNKETTNLNDSANIQAKHREWYEQWAMLEDHERFLFLEWILPRTLEDFRGASVVDAGCGPGHHINIVAPVAKQVLGIDLNTPELAAQKLSTLANVKIVEGDIAKYQPEALADVVYCIGVIHHTDEPDKTFANLKSMCRDGGLLIIWCYSREGNAMVWGIVEPIRKLFLRHLDKRLLLWISRLVTAAMYPIVYSIYLLPLKGLPFYEYFQNFRQLSFARNTLNVFDKLNAPQTEFITQDRISGWFNPAEFDDISITPYKGVSWRGSGRYKRPHAKS